MGLSPRLRSGSGARQSGVLPEGLPETTIPVKNKYFVPPWIGRSQTNFRLAVLNRSLDNDGYVYFLPDIPYVIFGRDPCAAHVFVGHPSVSRQHAVLEWHSTNRSCLLTDLGSKTGTTVDGVLLKSYCPHKIYIGSKIRFGESNRLYVFEPDPNAMEKANHRFHIRPTDKDAAPPPRPGSIPRFRSCVIDRMPRAKPVSDALSVVARPRSENGKSPWTRTPSSTIFKSIFQRVTEEERGRTTGVSGLDGKGAVPLLIDSDCEIVQETFKLPVSSADKTCRASSSASPFPPMHFSNGDMRYSRDRQMNGTILDGRKLDSDSDSDIEVVEVKTVGHRILAQLGPSRSSLGGESSLRMNGVKEKDRRKRDSGSVLGKRSWTERVAEREQARRERLCQENKGTRTLSPRVGTNTNMSNAMGDQGRDRESRERARRRGYSEVYRAEENEERETWERSKELRGDEENRDRETWEWDRVGYRARRSEKEEPWERITDAYKAEEREEKLPWERSREQISPRRRDLSCRERHSGKRARLSPDRDEVDTYPGREKNWHSRNHGARDARGSSLREERDDVSFRRRVRSHRELEDYRGESRAVVNESPPAKDARRGKEREERNLPRKRNGHCREREQNGRKDQADHRDCGWRDKKFSEKDGQRESQRGEREIPKGDGNEQRLQRTESLFDQTRIPLVGEKCKDPKSPTGFRNEVKRRRTSAKVDKPGRDARSARIRADGAGSRTVRDSRGGPGGARDARGDRARRQSPNRGPEVAANGRRNAGRDERRQKGGKREIDATAAPSRKAPRWKRSSKDSPSNLRGVDKRAKVYKNTWWKSSWSAYADPV